MFEYLKWLYKLIILVNTYLLEKIDGSFLYFKQIILIIAAGTWGNTYTFVSILWLAAHFQMSS